MTAANLRILFVDDDRVTRARVSFLLERNGYDVTLAQDGQEAWEILQEESFPMVISDWSMPRLDGPSLCKKIRAEEAEEHEYTYILLLTGMTEKAHIAQGLAAGADDYVTKPFDSGELLARIQVGRRILDLQARMRATEEELREQASRDGLTGALNRRALEDRLASAFAYLQRRGVPLSIAILDLDHFKSVNDNFGHQAGDGVLTEAVNRIDRGVRLYDTLGRYGGEEFVVILPSTPVDDARAIAERIRKEIADTPFLIGERPLQVTMSVGVATADATFTGSLKELIESADEALYTAKDTGRNRVVHACANSPSGSGNLPAEAVQQALS